MRKASADLTAATALAADADQADEVVGFHVQQAVEKAVKAVLAASAIEVLRTHDLTFLFELAADASIEPPISLDDADRLTPWAVTTRYDDIAEGFDRAAGLRIADTAVAWAAAALLPS